MEEVSKLNILVIEDNEEYRNYIRMTLKRVSSRYTVYLTHSLKEGIMKLGNDDVIDLVLMDLGLPDNEDFEGISRIHQINPGIPIIILTNLDDDEIGIEAIKRGASDYLTKKIVEPQLLHRMILYSIERKHILEELEENKKKLLRIQKMDSIVNLVGGIAHDFNNIITLIEGYSELIMNHDDTTAPIKNYTEQVYKASQRATKLIDQLSTFSRVENSLTSSVDINELIQDKLPIFANLVRNDINLELELTAQSPVISINPENLEQILVNLVSNSREAISSTGTINIRSAITPTCHFCDDHSEVASIELEDTGSGISEENLPYIFDPYFTTKESGTGLGLATVYGLVNQAQGCINVDSNVGVGTTITLCFPTQSRRNDNLPSSPAQNISVKGNLINILVVDDESEILELLRNMLTSENYQVDTANNAVEVLDRLKSASISPDLIISDVVMPKMTGLELANHVKDNFPGIEIILMSGYSPNYYETFDKTELTLIRKPFSKKEIINEIHKTMGA